MKAILFSSLVCTMLLGCASTPHPQASDDGAFEVTGWIFLKGELRIYERKEDIGKLFDGSCISGILSRQLSRTDARDRFDGMRVRIRATDLGPDALGSNEGGFYYSSFENYCASSRILLVQRIIPNPE